MSDPPTSATPSTTPATRPPMTRSLLGLLAVLLLALAPACAVMAALGGGHAVRLTVEILLPVGLVALTLAQLADAGRLRMRTLRGRFELGVALALGQLLAAVAIGAAVMFVDEHDAWMTIAIILFAAVVATRAAQLLLRGVVRDVRAIGDGLHAVERGERDVTIVASSGSELQELARTANRMIAALGAEERARDSADAARRQVIAAVSHDLRTPLSSLQLLSQALEDDLVDAETARRYVQTIGANVRTLGVLIDDLFELACLDAGEVAWSTAAVDLGELVGEAIELVRPTTEAARVRLSAELPAGLVPADANADKLRRVLLNLLQNAIHHTPPDGSIAVRASAVDGAVEVEVADTGAGIAAEDRPHVFEPFYRGGDEAARTRPGSGLGLAIARAIVEAHGGRIWLADDGVADGRVADRGLAEGRLAEGGSPGGAHQGPAHRRPADGGLADDARGAVAVGTRVRFTLPAAGTASPGRATFQSEPRGAIQRVS